MAAGAAGGFLRSHASQGPPELTGADGRVLAAIEPGGGGGPGTSTTPAPAQPDRCLDTALGPLWELPAEEVARGAGTAASRPIVLGPLPVGSAALTADYRFEDTFASSRGAAPDLVEVTPGSTEFTTEPLLGRDPVLSFRQGGGLALMPASRAIDRAEYTIELLFRFDLIDGWRKIVDLRDGRDDTGLYSLDGCLTLFDLSGAQSVTLGADRYVHVVLTRDASDTVAGYVDGVLQFSLPDPHELAVIDERDTLRFFVDDTTTTGEQSPGSVARIRLYDTALTANEVAGLACDELPDRRCDEPSWHEYLATADSICRAAGERFSAAVEELPGTSENAGPWHALAAIFSDEALAELYALPAPRARHHRLLRFYALAERQTGLLRRAAAAASAGATERAEKVMRQRVEVTHRKDATLFGLQRCPVILPA